MSSTSGKGEPGWSSGRLKVHQIIIQKVGWLPSRSVTRRTVGFRVGLQREPSLIQRGATVGWQRRKIAGIASPPKQLGYTHRSEVMQESERLWSIVRCLPHHPAFTRSCESSALSLPSTARPVRYHRGGRRFPIEHVLQIAEVGHRLAHIRDGIALTPKSGPLHDGNVPEDLHLTRQSQRGETPESAFAEAEAAVGRQRQSQILDSIPRLRTHLAAGRYLDRTRPAGAESPAIDEPRSAVVGRYDPPPQRRRPQRLPLIGGIGRVLLPVCGLPCHGEFPPPPAAARIVVPVRRIRRRAASRASSATSTTSTAGRGGDSKGEPGWSEAANAVGKY